MIYELIGAEVNEAYSKDGEALSQAYDLRGNELIESTTNLVVMSYNIQRFINLNSNLEMQQSIFNTYEPLIIGMQELNTYLNGLFTNYLYKYKADNSTTCVAVASKVPLTDMQSGLFENQTSANSARWQKCYFTFRGKEICWVNVHLVESSYESIKVAQARETFELVQNEPYFIITGDFNTVCKSVNDTEYTTIMKQFVDAGYNCANCTEQHGFIDTWTSGSTASGTWYPCDHIITSSNIDIDTVIADTTKIDVASQTGQSIDHLPLVAYLTIN